MPYEDCSLLTKFTKDVAKESTIKPFNDSDKTVFKMDELFTNDATNCGLSRCSLKANDCTGDYSGKLKV